MPSHNLEVAEQLFIWWNIGEHGEPNFDVIDPEIEFHTPVSSTGGAPYRGYDGIRRWITDIDDQFEDWWSRIDDLEEVDEDRVLAIGELHMRGRGSGVELDQEMAWLFTFRDGRLFRNEVFVEHEAARRAAGLED